MTRIAKILFWVIMAVGTQALAAPTFTVQPVGSVGFDVFADGVLAAPIRLAANGAILADSVVTNASGIILSGLHTSDPLAVTFAADDYVSITLSSLSNAPEPIVQFDGWRFSRVARRLFTFWFARCRPRRCGISAVGLTPRPMLIRFLSYKMRMWDLPRFRVSGIATGVTYARWERIRFQ